jgi:3-methyladenine DNA glycosylase AlkD
MTTADRALEEPVVDTLVGAIRAALRSAAEPVRAPQMQAYMKSQMPYLGVSVPVTRKITRRAVTVLPALRPAELIEAAARLWREAEYREERYAATELTGVKLAAGRLEMLPLCTEMIVTGAWWDHVDAVSPRIGAMLVAHRDEVEPVVRRWSTDEDRWLRRSSIICQLALGPRTDTTLLRDVIEPNLTDPEFFIRKGIGWALRQYARTDPQWVRAFVGQHSDEISPLSRREALKHL